MRIALTTLTTGDTPMNTEKTQHLHTLFNAIALHFPDWQCTVEEGAHSISATFSRDDGAGFVANYSDDTRRIYISGIYPLSPEGYGVIPERQRVPEATVCPDRTAAEIARHINRRFLPKYLCIIDACAKAEHQQAILTRRQERLHRAAPELLTALQRLLFFAEIYCVSDRSLYLSESFEAAHRAIAAATDPD